MVIDFIKFIHLLFAMGLLGLTAYAITFAHPAQLSKLISINKNLIVISLFALITGTLLIYPKHYNFHTLWIQAAYLLIFIYIVSLTLATRLSAKISHSWLWRCFYLALVFLLTVVVHDAVTKSTFFG